MRERHRAATEVNDVMETHRQRRQGRKWTPWKTASLLPIDFLVCWVRNSSSHSALPAYIHMSVLCNHRKCLKTLECFLCYSLSTINCT